MGEVTRGAAARICDQRSRERGVCGDEWVATAFLLAAIVPSSGISTAFLSRLS